MASTWFREGKAIARICFSAITKHFSFAFNINQSLVATCFGRETIVIRCCSGIIKHLSFACNIKWFFMASTWFRKRKLLVIICCSVIAKHFSVACTVQQCFYNLNMVLKQKLFLFKTQRPKVYLNLYQYEKISNRQCQTYLGSSCSALKAIC